MTETTIPSAPSLPDTGTQEAPKTTSRRGPAKKEQTIIVLPAKPYRLANPHTGFVHRPGEPKRVPLDAWTEAQIKAGTLVEGEL